MSCSCGCQSDADVLRNMTAAERAYWNTLIHIRCRQCGAYDLCYPHSEFARTRVCAQCEDAAVTQAR